MTRGWIGVDLDGTLAEYTTWQGPDHIGAPVPLMIARVKDWLAQGKDVRIFTARVCDPRDADAARLVIADWCLRYIGRVLPITHKKDWAMVELWDDRAIQVEPNTGAPLNDVMTDYVKSQRQWSATTFGPGLRTGGIIAHIKKELAEIDAEPADLEEWIDVITLAIDGYWRAGGAPHELMTRLWAKHLKNRRRQWPPSTSEDEATEHIRDGEGK